LDRGWNQSLASDSDCCIHFVGVRIAARFG
jgi:hypothetical protein